MPSLTSVSSGGALPMGDVTLTMPITEAALIEYKGDFFVKSGTSVAQLSPAIRSKLAGKSTDFLIPSHATAMGGTTSLSVGTSIVYGNGVYIRTAYYGAVMRSTDGVNWTPIELQNHVSSLSGYGCGTTGNMIFAAGYFMTAMIQGTQIAIFTSTDGLTWTQTNLASTQLNGTVEPQGNTYSVVNTSHDGTAFFVTAKVYSNNIGYYYDVFYRSIDALTWHVSNVYSRYDSNPVGGCIIQKTGASTWLAVSTSSGGGNTNNNPYYFYSTNGTSWTQASSSNWVSGPPALKALNGLVIGVVGLASATQAIWTSSNGGQTFTARATPSTVTLYDVTYGAGLYVAVGGAGTILTSPDGTTWTARTSGVGTPITVVEYDATAGRFIAVHSQGIRVSTDGINWTAATIPFTWGRSQAGSYGIKVLQFLNGAWWLVLDSDVIWKSTDGSSWTNVLSFGTPVANSLCQTNGTRAPYGLVQANGMVFAFSSNMPGFMVGNASTNSWSYKNPSGAVTTYQCAAYGNGLYVVVGNGGVIYTSPDLTTWTLRTSGTGTNLTAVMWSGSEFIAAGASYTARSTDGITWTSAGVTGSLHTYANGKFFILQSGTILLTSTTGAAGTWSSNTFTNVNYMRPFKYGVLLYGASTGVWWSSGGPPHPVFSTGTQYSDVAMINETIYGLYSAGNNFSYVPYPFASGAGNSIVNASGTTQFNTPGQDHSGSLTSLSTLFKINNDTVAISQYSNYNGFMHNFTNWVYAGLPGATYHNSLGQAMVLIDSTYNCWCASSSGFTWAPKTAVSSLTYSTYPLNEPTYQWMSTGTHYTQSINYRKVT